MKWKNKVKKHTEYGETRIRKSFCLLPRLDRDQYWHWLEKVGIVEYCSQLYKETWWFGDIWYVSWTTRYIIDVEIIHEVQKDLDLIAKSIVDREAINVNREAIKIQEFKDIIQSKKERL